MGRGVVVTMAAVVTLAVSVAQAAAQRRGEERATGRFDIAFIAADPVGELAGFFDQGFGAQLAASAPLDPAGHVRLRADGGFVVYGYERTRYCFSLPFGCRLEADLTTTNNIAFAGLGPELVLITGRFEPYLYAAAGVTAFFTSSSLDDDYGEGFRTTHQSDAMFSWRGGGGVRLGLFSGHRRVAIDIAVERQRNGVAEFLTEGDILDNPDGSITIFPNVSQADLTTFRVGFSIGMGKKKVKGHGHRH